MSHWEHDRAENQQRREDNVDAATFLLWLVLAVTAIACWHVAVEWFFGRLG